MASKICRIWNGRVTIAPRRSPKAARSRPTSGSGTGSVVEVMTRVLLAGAALPGGIDSQGSKERQVFAVDAEGRFQLPGFGSRRLRGRSRRIRFAGRLTVQK